MMSVAQMARLAKGKSPSLRIGGLRSVLAALIEESASLLRSKGS
jgi:hypothetical protein